jgi:hypothetical protein
MSHFLKSGFSTNCVYLEVYNLQQSNLITATSYNLLWTNCTCITKSRHSVCCKTFTLSSPKHVSFWHRIAPTYRIVLTEWQFVWHGIDISTVNLKDRHQKNKQLSPTFMWTKLEGNKGWCSGGGKYSSGSVHEAAFCGLSVVKFQIPVPCTKVWCVLFDGYRLLLYMSLTWMNEYRALVEWHWQEHWHAARKTCPVPLCTPQIPHRQAVSRSSVNC